MLGKIALVKMPYSDGILIYLHLQSMHNFRGNVVKWSFIKRHLCTCKAAWYFGLLVVLLFINKCQKGKK